MLALGLGLGSKGGGEDDDLFLAANAASIAFFFLHVL